METTVWFSNNSSLDPADIASAITRFQPNFTFHLFRTDSSCASDMFVLFHNPLRHQISDLFDLLRRVFHYIDSMQLEQCDALQQWLVNFSQMISLYFVAQKQVLYPFLSSKTTSSNVPDARVVRKPLLKQLISIQASALALTSIVRASIHEKTKKFDKRRRQQLIALAQLVSRFSDDLDQLFSYEIDKLVPIVAKVSSVDARRVERDAVIHIIDAGDAFGGYFRWLSDDIKEEYCSGWKAGKVRTVMAREQRWIRWQMELERQLSNGV